MVSERIFLIQSTNSRSDLPAYFAKDLHYRLVPLDLHFRGFLTKGEFEHEELRHMQAFYGAALISSYQREKNIDCTGLFLDAPLLSDCDIFFYEQYDQDTYFIHLMQTLNTLCFPEVDYPIDLILVGEAKWDLAYDFRYLRNIHWHMNNPDLHPRVRGKQQQLGTSSAAGTNRYWARSKRTTSIRAPSGSSTGARPPSVSMKTTPLRTVVILPNRQVHARTVPCDGPARQ
jgi:hypothetical protein